MFNIIDSIFLLYESRRRTSVFNVSWFENVLGTCIFFVLNFTKFFIEIRNFSIGIFPFNLIYFLILFFVAVIRDVAEILPKMYILGFGTVKYAFFCRIPCTEYSLSVFCINYRALFAMTFSSNLFSQGRRKIRKTLLRNLVFNGIFATLFYIKKRPLKSWFSHKWFFLEEGVSIGRGDIARLMVMGFW